MTRRSKPRFRLSPYVRAKIGYFLDLGDTEISFFGITKEDDPMAVIDIWLPDQACTSCSTVMDDDSIANWMDDMAMAGYHPDRYSCVWMHTHPGDGPNPSGTDEDTFAKVFGRKSLAVMYILARGGRDYCRIQWNHQLNGGLVGSDEVIQTEIDWSLPFGASDHAAWDEDFKRVVEHRSTVIVGGNGGSWNSQVGMPRVPSAAYGSQYDSSYEEWWEAARARAGDNADADDLDDTVTIDLEDGTSVDVPDRLKRWADFYNIVDAFEWGGIVYYQDDEYNDYVEENGKLVPCYQDEDDRQKELQLLIEECENVE